MYRKDLRTVSEIAEALKNPRGGRSTKDETDTEVVVRRTRNASLHMRRLVAIAQQLDKDDFNEIRETLGPIVESWQVAYKAKKSEGGAARAS